MEAERQSLYKAIGYAQGKALQPFTKEVCNILALVPLLSSVNTVCTCMINNMIFLHQVPEVRMLKMIILIIVTACKIS